MPEREPSWRYEDQVATKPPSLSPATRTSPLLCVERTSVLTWNSLPSAVPAWSYRWPSMVYLPPTRHGQAAINPPPLKPATEGTPPAQADVFTLNSSPARVPSAL